MMNGTENHTMSGYPRYVWWNELRREEAPTYQLVPLLAEEHEMLHRNKLSFLMEIIEGKLPQPLRLAHSM